MERVTATPKDKAARQLVLAWSGPAIGRIKNFRSGLYFWEKATLVAKLRAVSKALSELDSKYIIQPDKIKLYKNEYLGGNSFG